MHGYLIVRIQKSEKGLLQVCRSSAKSNDQYVKLIQSILYLVALQANKTECNIQSLAAGQDYLTKVLSNFADYIAMLRTAK